MAQRGFVDVPATGSHGGIVARGAIQRDLTINLVALRRLRGDREKELRSYILGLCLVAAAEPVDPFFRQGCLLVPDANHSPMWTLVERNGTRITTSLAPAIAFEYAQKAASAYGVGPDREVTFSKDMAKGEVGDVKKSKKDKSA